MTSATAAYLSRLRDLAQTSGDIDRFYLFREDDQLAAAEAEIADSDEASAFYDQLREQYREWRAAMGPEHWAAVVNHNEALTGADQNWLIDEIDEPATEARI